MTILRVLTFLLVLVLMQGCGERVSRRQIAIDIAIAPEGDAFAVTGSGFVIVFDEDQANWKSIVLQDLVYGVFCPTFNRAGDKLFFSIGEIQELSDSFIKKRVLGDSRTLNENLILTITEDGKFAMDSIGLIDVATGDRLASTESPSDTGRIRFLAASKDATWLVGQQGMDPDSNVLLLSRDGDEIVVSRRFELPEDAGFTTASMNRDGSMFCVPTTLGSVFIWKNSQLTKLTNWSGAEETALSANGHYLAIAGSNGLQVWDIEKEDMVSSSNDASFKHVSITADGSRIVALSLADEVHLFEMPDLTPILTVNVRDYIRKQ